MPSITITFDHPQADVPKYKFGDRIAVKSDYHPQNWLTGEVVGLMLETESYSPRWWCSIKLDAPHGLTEEYLEDDLIPVTDIAFFQVEWEQLEAEPMQESDTSSLPKFPAGARVRLSAESGFQNLIKDCAEVVSSKYISNESWAGWTYKLTNKDLTRPIEIGEIWLEYYSCRFRIEAFCGNDDIELLLDALFANKTSAK